MSESQIPRDRNHEPISEIGLEVAKGSIPGYSFVHKFGHSDAVGTTIGDIWNGAITYVFPSGATAMTLSSDDADDNSAGAGAQTVEIFGLDTNYNEINETLLLSGLAPVSTTKAYLRVFRMIVRTAGASGFNEGNIYLGTGTLVDGVPPNIFAEIIFTAAGKGENQTLMAIYTVPAGKTAYIIDYHYSTPQNKSAEMWIKVRPFGEVFQTKVRDMIFQNNKSMQKALPIRVEEKSDIKISAATDVGTTDIAASFDLILIDND